VIINDLTEDQSRQTLDIFSYATLLISYSNVWPFGGEQ